MGAAQWFWTHIVLTLWGYLTPCVNYILDLGWQCCIQLGGALTTCGEMIVWAIATVTTYARSYVLAPIHDIALAGFDTVKAVGVAGTQAVVGCTQVMSDVFHS